MSKQLSVSATASVLAMALFALVFGLGGAGGTAQGNGPMAAPLASITQ